MKQLFLLLVFLNIVYFFWGVTTGEKQMATVKPAPLYSEGEIEKLTLVLEGNIQQSVKPQVVIEDLPKIVKKTTCYMVEGFSSEGSAAQLMSNLSGRVVSAAIVSLRGAEEFWVIYPSSSDWNQSLANVEMLKEKGVTDLWLVPSGNQKGAISLGLFTTVGRAESSLKELASKKVAAEIIKREKARYGVKVEINGGIQAIRSYLSGEGVRNRNSIYEISC
jgi:hypothetical protein